MSLRHQIARRRLRRRGPIAMVFSVLTACGVTLLGLAFGLGPFTIFCRAVVSAILIGGLVSFGLSVINMANSPR